MKRPDTGKTFLDLTDINAIMPSELKLSLERHSRGVYCAANGCLISISNSRTYDKGYIAFNRNGAVGLAFYHPYWSVMGNDCRKRLF